MIEKDLEAGAAWDSGFVNRNSQLGRDDFALAKEIAQQDPVEPPPAASAEKGGLGRGMKKLFGRYLAGCGGLGAVASPSSMM